MSVILDDQKVFYASVPKVACTSLRRMFFEFENGFEFRPFKVNGKQIFIHNVAYKGLLRENFPEKRIADFHRVTLVRDPIQRLLSAFGNRVVHHKELSKSAAGANLKKLDLAPNPDLDLFIEKFDDYRQAHPSISHHTRPIVDILGDDPDYFAKIYPLHDIKQFVADMSERLGAELNLGRSQTGGPKFKVDDLTAGQIEKLKTFYAKDYEIFGEFF
ncbi:hypothetical protein NBRC116590_31500 [Pelagimonas sp. KU-00592-HH]|uniref:sulfotransferase family 2 domain-containing protein n=1 Tax=Pelagimonas sp. KU-00592-HH TaxID=3127651 RepID=UPI00310B8915